MNLLPKVEDEFSKPEYWNNFFRKRGSKEFEWYGEYPELCGDLHKYIKPKDKILVVGCGNSKLSCDLYDVGCKNIINIDISSVVIKQMQNGPGKDRPDMSFKQMDVLSMSFQNDEFSVVLDKGTLDALMPKATYEDVQRARGMFAEVNRVLKTGGRYLIVSLLQEHILETLLDSALEMGWMFRISRCHEVERRALKETGQPGMPVFMVICTQFKVSVPLLELSLFIEGQMERAPSREEVLKRIKSLQSAAALCCSMSHKPVKEEMDIVLMEEGKDQPRYTLRIVDSSRDHRQLHTYAAFIAPQGRETDWLFASKEGRSYLQKTSNMDRLAIVCLHREQKYESMTVIQDELRSVVLQFAPRAMMLTSSGYQVPYLTLGEGVGRRETVFRGHSKLSGDLIVEQVEVDGETLRRLVFLSNQAVVQSEVKMIKANKKKKSKLAVDSSHVASSYLMYMSAATAILTKQTALRVAVIGLGGGALCTLNRQLFPQATVIGVEIDPLIAQIAQDWFGLKPDKRLSLVVQDGLEFLREKAEKQEKLDVVMFDVDSKERGAAVSCPPPAFLESHVLADVSAVIAHTGVFVMNFVCRLKKNRDDVIKTLRQHFSAVCWYHLEQEVNQIIYSSNLEGLSAREWKTCVEEGARTVAAITKDELKEDNSIDIAHLLEDLSISL